MEHLETLKEALEMLVFILSRLPTEFKIGLGIIFCLTCLLTYMLSKTGKKKENKKAILKAPKLKPIKRFEEDSNNKEIPNEELLKTEPELPFVENKVEETESKDSFDILDIEIFNDLAIEQEEESQTTTPELSIPITNDLLSTTVTNLKLDRLHTVDKVYVNEKGVYLIFNDDRLRGNLSGSIDDEYLTLKDKPIVNPFVQKSCYIKKLNRVLNINEDFIKVIIINNRTKILSSKLNLFKSIEDFELYLNEQPSILTEEALTKIVNNHIFLRR